MKKIINCLVLIVTICFATQTFAATKIAVVDIMSILQQMPQREKISKALDAEFSSRAKLLQNEKSKVTEAAVKLQKENLTLSASEKTKLTNLVTAYEEKANSFTNEFRARENEEANKLLTLIQNEVVKIAEKEKYEVVIKAEAAFYYVNSIDITQKVLNMVKK